MAITCEHLGALELIMAIAITVAITCEHLGALELEKRPADEGRHQGQSVAITCEHLGALELEERRAAYAELEHLQQRQSMAINGD